MTLICVIFFVLLSVLTATAVIETTGTEHAISRVIQITSFHVVAFLVVGLLASRLSDRRTSGEQLKETAKSLANLRALHERIVESIRSGLITTDLEGRIYTFNSAASEITGFSAEEMRGKTIFSLFGDIRQPIELSLQAVNDGEQQPRFEADLLTPEGFAVRIGLWRFRAVFGGERGNRFDHHVSGPDRDPFDGRKRAAQGPACGSWPCRCRPCA